jgi:hypothetical protein
VNGTPRPSGFLLPHRIRWTEGAWGLLVLLAAVLMACGLAGTFTFIVEPPTYPVAHRLVLLGAIVFAAAAVWAWLRGSPRWVAVLTGLPAVVVGGLALQFEDGGWGWLTGMFLIPAAVIAMLLDLIYPWGGDRQHTKYV